MILEAMFYILPTAVLSTTLGYCLGALLAYNREPEQLPGRRIFWDDNDAEQSHEDVTEVAEYAGLNLYDSMTVRVARELPDIYIAVLPFEDDSAVFEFKTRQACMDAVAAARP